MLVISRKQGQQIEIGDEVRIVILQIRPGTVRIGIQAPDSVRVLRSELVERNPDDEKPTSK